MPFYTECINDGNGTYKTKISLTDSISGYLFNKLVAGTNMNFVQNNIGGNETMTLNSSSSGSGSGFQSLLTGVVDGANLVFTWNIAPSVMVVDSVTIQKIQQDGTVMWSGTTTTTLLTAPNFSIFAVA